MNNNKKIGKIIRYIRIQGNLTQEDLAKRIHIGRSTLSDYEREKTDINFDTIINLLADYIEGKNDLFEIKTVEQIKEANSIYNAISSAYPEDAEENS